MLRISLFISFAFFLLLTALFNLYSRTVTMSSVVINEIMPAPEGDEPEWIELFNPNSTTVTLLKPLISDAQSTKPLPDLSINSRSYLILCKDPVALKNIRNIPANAVVVEAKLPSLNNTGDKVILRNNDSSIIDEIFYESTCVVAGRSLERRLYQEPADCSHNLYQSISPDGATAGYINSVSPVDFDVSVIIPNINLKNELLVIVENLGMSTIKNVELTVYLDVNSDGSASEDELFDKQIIDKIDSAGEKSFTYSKLKIIDFAGSNLKYFVKANVALQNDQREGNDKDSMTFSFSPDFGAIELNEFLFDPKSGCADFIELHNVSRDSININSWIVHDRPAKYGYDSVAIKSDFILAPDELAVICWDTAFFNCYNDLKNSTKVYYNKSSLNLNADGDDIYLVDFNGNVIDSLSYATSWHNKSLTETKGISLEKLSYGLASNNSNSWTSSLDSNGATPCRTNSVLLPKPDESILKATPNPFSPFGSSRSPNCMISYNLPFKRSIVSAKIFTPLGESVIDIANSEQVYSTGSYKWDGRNKNGSFMQPGPYIFVVEARDIESEDIRTERLLIVIGK